MAVTVTCRAGHVTHRSEVDADAPCKVCGANDEGRIQALTLAAKIADAYFVEQGNASTVLGDRIRRLIRNPSP